MKLTSAALLFLAAGPMLAPFAVSQTKTSTVHHTPARAAAKPATDGCGTEAAQPTLPLAVPRIAGCTKPLYELRYIDTVVGSGAVVQPRRWLTVNYTGYLTDGSKFDSSIGKEPITFPYGAHQVISGWDTGFEGMNIGGKRRLFIPYQLAYGADGRPPVIPAKAELIFDVELLGISETPPAPKTPPTPPAGSTPPPATSTPQPGTSTPPPAGSPATPPPTADPTKPTATPPKP